MADALEVEHFSKTFDGSRVLDDVTLHVRRGDIHGLVGMNGSGKSTLIKILAGYHAPDEGDARLVVQGVEARLPLKEDSASSLGLSFMHQDLGLVASLTVLENVRVGRFETGIGGRIRWSVERERVRRALRAVDANVDCDTLVEDMSALDRALVALARCLMTLEGRDGGVLVLDEPTAFMPEQDIARMFDAVRQAAAGGSGVIFVTHRIHEIIALTNRVSVLRDGRLVGTRTTAEIGEAELVKMLLGRDLGSFYPDPRSGRATGEPVFAASGLSGERLRDMSFDVYPGEIVGFTGLRGMGHEEIPYVIFGSHTTSDGMLSVGGRTTPAVKMTPRLAIKLGVVLVTADRQRTGIVGDFSILNNASLPIIAQLFVHGRIRRRSERAAVTSLVAEHGVVPSNIDLPTRLLSGGNQQKLILGKWLQLKPRVCLLHEPTAGIDVGAKKIIFERIQAIADSGDAVVICSDEWEDLAHICDRVGIVKRGRILDFLAGETCTEDQIAESCYRSDAG